MLWKLALVAALATGASAFKVTPLNVTERDRLEGVAKELIGRYCLKNKAASSIETAQFAMSSFRWCVEKVGDLENLMLEISLVKPEGDFIQIVKKLLPSRDKYCSRTRQLKNCIDSLAMAVEPCTPAPFRHFVNLTIHISMNVADFLCINNGNRIYAFVKAEGPECFLAQYDVSKKCIDDIIDKMPDFFTLIGSEVIRCKLYEDLAKCVVNAMDQCKNKTPANMADSLFKFILRRITPCRFAKPE